MQSKAKRLERQETVQQNSMVVGGAVLKEASVKLQAALKNNDFKEGSVAQAIIKAARKNIGSEDRVTGCSGQVNCKSLCQNTNRA